MTQIIELRAGAWYNEKTIQLDFPDKWEVVLVSGKSLPRLSDTEIRNKIALPFDTKTLRQISVNKKSAAIIVDDLTRPTPAANLVKFVCEELLTSGIKPKDITILIAGGTHSPSTQFEIEKKIGQNIHQGIRVQTHNSYQDTTYLGKTENHTPIYINKTVVEADVKIGIGGIYPHPAAGFSGGAKILAPAAAGFQTIVFLHDHFRGSTNRGVDLRNEFRRECESIAKIVGLDFIVNAVINENREIIDIFAGDFISAWLAGTEFAKDTYSVHEYPDADIVIADAYPFDTSLQFVHDRGLWPLDLAPREADKIALALSPGGSGTHVLFPAKNSFQARLWRRFKHFHWKDLKTLAYRFQAAKKLLNKKHKNYIVVSPNLSEDDVRSVFPSGKLYSSWREVKAYLTEKYKSKALKVVFYKNAPLLLPTNLTNKP